MTPTTQNEPDDRRAVQGKTVATIRCGLCRETVLLESNFRPTLAVCPHCGLNFTFDPQKQPLPVCEIRLNWSALDAAQRCGDRVISHRRHDAHVSPRVVSPPAKGSFSHYLVWAGTLAIGSAGILAILSWLHR